MSSIRITGINTGLDVDQIVKDLMKVHYIKADRLTQNKQLITWQKQQYREIINSARQLRDKYFDLLSPATSLLNPANFNQKSASSSNSVVTVSAQGNALIGETDFRILESATAARAVAAGICQDSATGTRLELTDTIETVMTKLGGEGFSFDDNGDFTVRINDADITVNKNDTFGALLNKINSSDARVSVYYSSFSDTLTYTAKTTGNGYITTDNGGNFFSAIGIQVDNGRIGTPGRDARFEINGLEGSRSSNTFTIDGITYQIQSEVNSPTEIIKITTRLDVDGIYNLIQNFVSDYNAFIDTVNGKLKEERYADFLPLTDEQKAEMTDKEIEQWEEKAKSGLLRNEPVLEAILRDLRQAIYNVVGELHISQIGIETSNNWREQGKLVLKNGGSVLKQAIADNPDKVAELFTRSSGIAYNPDNTIADSKQRFQESGLAHRISDILKDNIRTTRNSKGHKGILLEKAGIEGDTTEFLNYMDRQIRDIDRQILKLNDLLLKKEEQYYRQFAALEKAMQQLYSQGDWLAAQLNQL